MTLFLWQGFGFTVRREISLADTPRLTLCRDGMVLIGNKKSYEIIDTSTFSVIKVLDVEKEHRMAALEVIYVF